MISKSILLQLAPLGVLAVLPFLLFSPLSAENAFTNNGNNNHNHAVTNNGNHNMDSLFLEANADKNPVDVANVFTSKDLAGDAKTKPSSLVVTDVYIDDNRSCESCIRVDYTPSVQGVAGMSYINYKGLDLTNAKRITFDVREISGNAKVKFLIAGKKIDGTTTNVSSLGIFQGEKFAKSTKFIPLVNRWKNYEVDVSDINLNGVTHPFAFEVKSMDGGKVTFYLEYIIYDEQTAGNPLRTDTP